MSDLIFIQRSQFGRSIFALRGDTLEITSHHFGRKSSVSIPLRSISPDYVPGANRLWPLIVVPMGFAAICIWLIRLFQSYEAFPVDLTMYPAMVGVISLLVAIRGARRVEYFIFSDQWKNARFSIIRDPTQREECDAFVRELLDRIEHPEAGPPPAEVPAVASAPVSSVQLPSADDDPDELQTVIGWKFAIAAGVASNAFPLVSTTVLKEPASLSGDVVLVACGCSAFAAIWSFSVRERGKYWSLAGLALALLPFAIY